MRKIINSLLIVLFLITSLPLTAFSASPSAEDLFKEGNAFMKEKKYEQAVDSYTKSIKLNSKIFATFNNRALAYYNLKKNDEALSDFQEAIKLGTKDASTFFNAGYLLKEKGKYKEAFTKFKEAINLKRDYASAYYNIAQIYERFGEDDSAVYYYSLTLRHNPKFSKARNAKRNINKRRFKVKSIDLSTSNSYMVQAMRHSEKIRDTYDPEKAIDLYTKALEANPMHSGAYTARAKVYTQTEEYEKAIEDYTKLFMLNPLASDSYQRRGELYSKLGKSDLAKADYDRSNQLKKGYTLDKANKILSESKSKTAAGKNTASKTTTKKQASTVKKETTTAVNKKSGSDFKVKDYKDYSKQKQIKAHMSNAKKAASNNDWKLAADEYTKALMIDPKNDAVLFERGLIYMNEEATLDKAIADFEMVIQLKPKDFYALHNLASIYKRKKQYQNALRQYTSALRIAPNDALLYKDRGLLYQDMDQYDKAIADYNKALEFNPELWDALANRGKLYNFTGRYQKAIEDYNDFLKRFPAEKKKIRKTVSDLKKIAETNLRNNAPAPMTREQGTKQSVASSKKKQLHSPTLSNVQPMKMKAETAEEYVARGMANLEQGYKQAAEDDFRKAMNLNPNLADAHYGYGLVMERKGNPNSAFKNFIIAVQKDPNHAKALDRKGGFLVQSKRTLKQGCADLQKACQLGVCNTYYHTQRTGSCK